MGLFVVTLNRPRTTMASHMLVRAANEDEAEVYAVSAEHADPYGHEIRETTVTRLADEPGIIWGWEEPAP